MPVSYQFIDVKTGKPVELDQIDRSICQDMGKTYSDERYSIEFLIVSSVGDVWTSEKWRESGDLDALMKLMNFDETIMKLCRKYLVDEYTYDCWR